jgi:secretion/DNA translocation related TadE-like protein
MSRSGSGDSGYATVWVVIAMAIVVLVGGVCAVVGAVTMQRHRAAAAADAAALEAALASIAGPTAACHDAGVLAAMDGASLVTCQLDGSVADVAVAVQLPGPLGRFGATTARARAGPATRTLGMFGP